MRVVVAAFALIAFTGCSMSPERYERIVRNCNDADVDCRPESIRSRVLEAFPSIEVREVVACATRPTEFCSSALSDEDACVVSLAKPLPAVSEPSEIPELTPRVIRQLLGPDSDAYRPLVTGERPDRYGYGRPIASIYVSDDSTRVVLHLAEMRCIDINEII
jgi:hypothetical protein